MQNEMLGDKSLDAQDQGPGANQRFKGVRVALLTAGPTAGPAGGAERHFQGLHDGLVAIGCDVQWINVPADEPDFATILQNYEHCRSLDLQSFDVVISTKAPTYAIEHPAHVMHLVHTIRAFDDMFDTAFPEPNAVLYKQRAQIHAMEFEPLSRVKARFSIGKEISDRLYRWRGMSAEVIHRRC